MRLKRSLKIFLIRNFIVAVTSLVLHGIWEYVACGIFYAYGEIENMNRLMVEATIGDVGIALLIFNLLLLLRKDLKYKLTIKDYLIVVLYGIIGAYYFETRALSIDRWVYNSGMTIIPVLNVGLIPVLQLVILIPISLFLEGFGIAKLGKYEN